MNKKENRKKLVAALRSGEFTQTTGRLQTPEGYCCLGVSAVVYERETGNKLPRDSEGYLKGQNLLHIRNVQKFFGFQSDFGIFSKIDKKDTTSLVALNDFGYDFNYIADIIESEPPGLFDNEEGGI